MRTHNSPGTLALAPRWAGVFVSTLSTAQKLSPLLELSAKPHIPLPLSVPKAPFSSLIFSQDTKHPRKKTGICLTLDENSPSSHLLSFCAGCQLSFSSSSPSLTCISPLFFLSPLPLQSAFSFSCLFLLFSSSLLSDFPFFP